MTDPTARQAITELFSGRGWPRNGDELLRRSLGPRSPELLLEAPGWLGLAPGDLVLDAGCRDATFALALARRERIGSEWFEHRLERDPGSLTQDLLEVARLTRDRERLEAALGPVWYGRALAFALWGPQIVLGRLVPVLYVLVKRP